MDARLQSGGRFRTVKWSWFTLGLVAGCIVAVFLFDGPTLIVKERNQTLTLQTNTYYM